VNVIYSRGTHVRIIGDAVNDNHLSGVPFICRLDGSSAYHKRLIDIHTGCNVRRTSLQRGEFHTSGLASDFRSQEAGQISSCSLKLLMSERIHIISASGKFADISAIRQVNPFRYRYHNRIFLFQKILYLFQEFLNIEIHFRQINQIRTFTLLRFCQRRGPGEPSRIAPHNLDHRDHRFVIGQTQCVADHFLGGCSDVFGCASKSRCMVRQRQVIVDRFRYAEKFLRLSGQDSVIAQLFDRVHGIIAADIDKRLNIQAVQNFKNFLKNLPVLMNFRQFIPTGAEKSGRRPLQKFNVQFRMNLSGQIHVFFIQKSLNAMKHTVYFVKTTFLCIFIYAGQ